MIQKETFARGIQLINAVLSEKFQIKDKTKLDSYYLLVGDLNEDYYLKGIVSLMKTWESPNYAVGPGNIREAVEKEEYGNLEIEEILLLAEIYRKTGVRPGNNELFKLISSKNIEDIKEKVPPTKQLGHRYID